MAVTADLNLRPFDLSHLLIVISVTWTWYWYRDCDQFH